MRSKRMALNFLSSLQPGDEIGVLTYSTKGGLKMRQYLTRDHERIKKILEGIGMRGGFGRAEDAEGKRWDEMEELFRTQVGGGKYSEEGAKRLSEMVEHAKEFERKIFSFSHQVFPISFSDPLGILNYLNYL